MRDPLCVCVWAADPKRTRARLERLSRRAAVLELRLDRVAPDYPLGDVFPVEASVIATCRPPREGGAWAGSEAARLALLQRAVDAGAEWVDLEWDVDPSAVGGAQRIRSRHVFQPCDPARWGELLDSVAGTELGKLALAVEGAEDALRLLELAVSREPRPLVVALDSAGVASRVLGPSLGQRWVYAADAAPTGPGQLAADDLSRLWRGGRARARIAYGVVGRPVAHSRSPQLFNHAFAELGVDALYTWLEATRPSALWDRCARDPRWRGFSVTVPHKQAAARWADELEPAAAATGAANTLSRRGAGWRGDNTDARALLALLGEREVSGVDARVLGSGGVARAAVWALGQLGAQVTVHARSADRGGALAEAFHVAWGGGFEGVPSSEGRPRIVVQATSVGMQGGPDPEGALLPPSAFGPEVLLYELVYTPRETPLVRCARARGAQVIDGVTHFVAQARAQLEAWHPELEVDDARWAELVATALEAPAEAIA